MKLIAFFCLLLLFSCDVTEKDKANIKEMDEQAPVQEAYNVTYLYSDSAIIQAKLTASHVQEEIIQDVQYSIFDQGMRLEFFSPNGETKSVLTGNHGKINMEKGIAIVTGNVVVLNQKGDRMESEKLTWNKGEDKVHSDQFVKIITSEEIIYGDSLDASPDFGTYKIYKIRGIIKVKEEGNGDQEQ